MERAQGGAWLLRLHRPSETEGNEVLEVRRSRLEVRKKNDGLRKYSVRKERRDRIHHLQPAEGAERFEPQDYRGVASRAARCPRGHECACAGSDGRGREIVCGRRGHQRAGPANTGEWKRIFLVWPERLSSAGDDGQAVDLRD